MSVTAVVLAGGLATRMGGEKPLRLLHGRTLLGHALAVAAPLARQVLVAGGRRDLPLPPGVTAVPDLPGLHQRGPLSGILAGLAAASHDRVLCLSCDMPWLSASLLQALLAALGQHQCAYCTLPGSPGEPLPVALRREPALARVRAALEAGNNRVLPLWRALDSRVFAGTELAAFGDPALLLRNLNTPEDLAAAEGADPGKTGPG